MPKYRRKGEHPLVKLAPPVRINSREGICEYPNIPCGYPIPWEMKKCTFCGGVLCLPENTPKCPACQGDYPGPPSLYGDIQEQCCEALREIAYHLENISRKL